MAHQLRQQPDCIQNLILNQTLDKNCEIVTVSLSRMAMEALDEKHYILAFPNETRTHTVCGREDYTVLQGSYLATIPSNCFLYTSEFTITNQNDHVEGQPLKIMKMPHIENIRNELPEIHLKTIDLSKLQKAQSAILWQSPAKLQPLPSEHLYHTTIPFYITLVGIIIIVGIYISIKRRKIFQNKTAANKSENQIYTEPTKCDRVKIQPAIFPQLKAQK